MTKRELEKANGWGCITASAASALAWGFLAALHRDINPGILGGSFIIGIWQVSGAGRYFR